MLRLLIRSDLGRHTFGFCVLDAAVFDVAVFDTVNAPYASAFGRLLFTWLEKPGDRGREGPYPPGPIDSIFWGIQGDTINNENGLFLFLLNCFSPITMDASVVLEFEPFETLVGPFLRGPKG